LTIVVLRGSVATGLKCCGRFDNYFIASCTQNFKVKKIEKRLIFAEDVKNDTV